MRGFDLNRNFPNYFNQNKKRSQPEEWMAKIQFVLSGNIHGGAFVASHPLTTRQIPSSGFMQSSVRTKFDVNSC